MKSPSPTLTALVLSLSLIATVAFAGGGASVGRPAPPIAGKDLNGKPVNLASLRGNVVIVDFWASWCKPCKDEMPVLQRLHAKYGKHGLSVVGVSVDEEAGNAKAFAKKLKVTFPSIHDGDHAIAESYKPKKMPTSVIVDRKGVVRFVHAGFRPEDARKIEQEVRSLLK